MGSAKLSEDEEEEEEKTAGRGDSSSIIRDQNLNENQHGHGKGNLGQNQRDLLQLLYEDYYLTKVDMHLQHVPGLSVHFKTENSRLWLVTTTLWIVLIFLLLLMALTRWALEQQRLQQLQQGQNYIDDESESTIIITPNFEDIHMSLFSTHSLMSKKTSKNSTYKQQGHWGKTDDDDESAVTSSYLIYTVGCSIPRPKLYNEFLQDTARDIWRFSHSKSASQNDSAYPFFCNSRQDGEIIKRGKRLTEIVRVGESGHFLHIVDSLNWDLLCCSSAFLKIQEKKNNQTVSKFQKMPCEYISKNGLRLPTNYEFLQVKCLNMSVQTLSSKVPRKRRWNHLEYHIPLVPSKIYQDERSNVYSTSIASKLRFWSKPSHNDEANMEGDNKFAQIGPNQNPNVEVKDGHKIYLLDEAPDVKPPSVLILGMSRLSSHQAIRSLPKTMQLLYENNFVHFRGYHKLGNGHLENIVPLLTGCGLNQLYLNWDQKKRSRRRRRKRKSPSFDKTINNNTLCWNIFQIFSSLNYITLNGLPFPELKTDEMVPISKLTLDYPADFNQGALFKFASEHYSKNILPNSTCESDSGYSKLRRAILDYTTDFLQTFKGTPTFGAVWLPPDPTLHSGANGKSQTQENINYQAVFENSAQFPSLNPSEDLDFDIYSFFQRIFHKGLAKNTVIIFVTDEGISEGSGYHFTPEGILESSLPLLMFHLPKHLDLDKGQRSNFTSQGLVENSMSLRTPFDVHETMRELLQKYCFSLKSVSAFTASGSADSQQSSKDAFIQKQCLKMFPKREIKESNYATALWKRTESAKNCESAGIPEKTCMCGLQFNTKMFLGPLNKPIALKRKLHEFGHFRSETHLNNYLTKLAATYTVDYINELINFELRQNHKRILKTILDKNQSANHDNVEGKLPIGVWGDALQYKQFCPAWRIVRIAHNVTFSPPSKHVSEEHKGQSGGYYLKSLYSDTREVFVVIKAEAKKENKFSHKTRYYDPPPTTAYFISKIAFTWPWPKTDINYLGKEYFHSFSSSFQTHPTRLYPSRAEAKSERKQSFRCPLQFQNSKIRSYCHCQYPIL